MSGGDFIGRAEAQRCRARGIEDRAGFVADLRAVLDATADSDVPVTIPNAEIYALIERRMPVQESHLVALYGAEGCALRRAFGVDRRGDAEFRKIKAALEKRAPRRLTEQKTTVGAVQDGAASFPPDVAGDGGEGAELDTPPPPTDSGIECLAGGAAGPSPVPGQTGEAVPPTASPTPAGAGAGPAAQAEDARDGGAAGVPAPAAPMNLGRAIAEVADVAMRCRHDELRTALAVKPTPDPSRVREGSLAAALGDLEDELVEAQADWQRLTGEALARQGRIDALQRAIDALRVVA